MALQSSLGLGVLRHTITDAVTQREQMLSSLCVQAGVYGSVPLGSNWLLPASSSKSADSAESCCTSATMHAML